MNNWREDAQPEWPEAASGTPAVPPPGRDSSVPSAPSAPSAAETQVLPDAALAGRRAAVADSGADTGADADRTAVLPKAVRPRQSPESYGARSVGSHGAKVSWGTDGSQGAREPRSPRAPQAFTTAQASPAAQGSPAVPRDARPADAESTTVLRAVRPPTPSADAETTTVLRALGPRPYPDPGRTTAAPRDPWAETDDVDRTARAGAATQEHDPHEVTVQLDAVQLGDVTLRPVKGGAGAHEGSDGPVFVDETGRRNRTWRRLGLAVGLACAGYAAVIVATLLSGSSDAPWLPVPGQKGEKPAGQVDIPLRPTESARPSGTGASLPPDADPTDGESAAPAPGSSPDGAATAPDVPDSAVADPSPTPTGTTAPKPATGVTQPVAEPSQTTVTEPAPEPSTPTAEPITPEPPSETGGGRGNGGGNGGGAGTSALAVPSSAQPSPSPEYVL